MENLDKSSDQRQIQKEMLELIIKAGRRLMHDFDHMLNEVPEDCPEKQVYIDRAKIWRDIFYPDDGFKNYRASLHKEMDHLERSLQVAHKLLKEHGIDPEPHLPF